MNLSMRSSSRALLFAAILALPPATAPADDGTSLIPLASGTDGSSLHVEVSRTGNRSKAVPVVEIPGDTVRMVKGTDWKGSGPPDLPGIDGEEGTVREDEGSGPPLRSLLVREGPEGVSLGNAFDLLGEIQEAVEKVRNREPPEGFARSGNDDVADRQSVSGKGSLAEHRDGNATEDLRSRVH